MHSGEKYNWLVLRAYSPNRSKQYVGYASLAAKAVRNSVAAANLAKFNKRIKN